MPLNFHRLARCTPAALAACALLVTGCAQRNATAHVQAQPDTDEEVIRRALAEFAIGDLNNLVFDPSVVDKNASAPATPAYGVWRDRSVRATDTDPNPAASPLNLFGEVAGFQNVAASNERGALGQADNLHQVSYAIEGADFDPVISRDGRFLVYASTQHSKRANLYVKPVNGRAVTQLTNNDANDVMPSISPDGSRIAFASDRSGSWNIYIMNVGGGQAVQVTSGAGHELHPTWSPDARFIAFCRLGEVSGRWELWVTEASNPSTNRFIGYGLFPTWSPVDDKIAFQRSREQGDRYFSVWTLDFVEGEGANPTEIASSPIAAVVKPTWSPDGRFLAFTTIPNPIHELGQRPRHADIWISHLDGTGRANLTGGAFVNISPTWAADGTIFFVSNRSGRDNIWSVRPLQAMVAGGRSADQNIATSPEERRSPGASLAEVNPDR
jgi:TolB protein